MAYNSTITVKKRYKHGQSGRSGSTAEYRTWKWMRVRCLNPNFIGYEHYGGRGITICQRWMDSFLNFFEDMGKRPSDKHSLDRIDTNGNYEPINCRWALRQVQNSNTRRNRFITYNGNTRTMAEWARRIGITQTLLCDRMETRTFEETVEFFKKKGRPLNEN